MTARRPTTEPELIEREIPNEAVSGSLATILKAEIDTQIATAQAFPRRLSAFREEAETLVRNDTETAEACIYALPRDGKTVTGPSARFAELLAYSFGNNRSGGRVVAEEGNFIVAQGVFHDLEKNSMVTMEVKRRITDKYGRRYKDDMIVVTGNAAAAIAHRNAVLKGVPKALWKSIYDVARAVAVGDASTVTDTRERALAWFAKAGVTPAQVFAKLGVAGAEDIGLAELETLVGLKTAIKEGGRPEDVFALDTVETSGHNTTTSGGLGSVVTKMAERRAAKAEPVPRVDEFDRAGAVRAAIEAATTVAELELAAEGIADVDAEAQAALYDLAETRRDSLELP